LDVVDDKVVQSDATAQDVATWEVTEAGSGLYRIAHAETGLLLGVDETSVENGAPVLISENAGSDEQLWQLVPDNSGNVRLTSYGSGLVLGVEEMSTEPGAAIVQWTDGALAAGCTADGPRQEGRIGSALDFCHSPSYVNIPDGVVSDLDGDWSIST